MKEIIITSSVLILCIMLVRHFCKGKIGSRLQYALWLVVAVRLIIPVTAQLYLSFGAVDGFCVMNLVEDLEEDFGDITERLDQPIGFAMNMDSLISRQIARYILAQEIERFDTADGATSIFLAGRIGVTWLDILQGVWRGGMGIMLVWMVVVNFRFGYKLHKQRREFFIPEPVFTKLHKRLSRRFAHPVDGKGQEKGICRHSMSRTGVKIYTVEQLASPCLYGLPGWEAVYLPEKITGDEAMLRHVLTHEMCHKRHGDGFWSLLRNGLLAVYWFHPLVWAAAALSKRDCELACDEEALALLGEEERISYGKTLLFILSGKGRLSDFACTATTMTGLGKSIKERIRYIAEKPKVIGAAVVVSLILIMAVSILTFAKSRQFSGGTWERGRIYVMTGDKRIMLPGTIARISGYAEVEGKRDDLIVYQVASDQEVGRFCTVSYEEAAGLVEEGRTVVPLGNYGSNPQLKQYMGILEEEAIAYIPSKEVTESGYDTPEVGRIERGIEEKPEKIAENRENGVPGTDRNDDGTDPIVDAAGDSIKYLPEESVTQIEVPADTVQRDCYLYVTAEYVGMKEEYLEEILYIDEELKNAASQVIVTTLNREITEETFEILAEYKTQYLGDNSAVVALVNALSFSEGLSYEGIEMATGETQKKVLQIYCSLALEDVEMGKEEEDLLFFDAAMLFAVIENLEECIFVLRDGEGFPIEEVVYNREEMTKRIGVESLWKDLEGEELCGWLKELHQRVLLYL